MLLHAIKKTLFFLGVASTSIILFFLILIASGPLAKLYIKNYPEVVMSPADRINQNTRAVREALIPYDKIAEWYDFEDPAEMALWWEERFNAGAEFESYSHFRPRPLLGKYHGVSEAGYRQVRNNGPWPVEDKNYNIFFFGGSTSFGVGPYWATVASYLQETLDERSKTDKPVRVYNFGRPGYHSTQELILLSRLLSEGNIPDMVVFLDGLNDFCFRDGNPSGWTALSRFFDETNKRHQERAAGYGVNTDWLSARDFFASLPAVELVNAIIENMLQPPIPDYVKSDGKDKEIETEEGPPKKEIDKVIERYFLNTRQIRALGKDFNFKVLFAWQPVPHYKYDPQFHQFYPTRVHCHVGSRDGYPIMAEREEWHEVGSEYLWLADLQEAAQNNLYVDAFHYTAPMSRDIAHHIADKIHLDGLIQ